MSYFEGLPEFLKVGPFKVRLEIKAKLEDEDIWGGFYNSDDNRAEYVIELRMAQPTPAFALDTVLHEVMHAIYKTFGLTDGETEEKVASALATGWVMVLRDNPELTKWIGAAATA